MNSPSQVRLAGAVSVWLWLVAAGLAHGADHPPAIPREFRAAWIATVANIDWPSKPGLPAQTQRDEMIALLDSAVELNLNAIVLQVRPACDAIYPSELEPWSPYLSGTMGEPPGEDFDPLEFAVAEAHRRGLLLHAWFNPYRASHPTYKGKLAENHISRTLPDSVVEYGAYRWLDPSDESASRRSLDVILDVVRRYDIDGVHFDDYFYPYPISEKADESPDAKSVKVPFPDDRSWRRYVEATSPDARLSRADWRRQSVNHFVRDVHLAIKQEKPHVLFGISPFGIWRPGHPESVVGFDAYEELYADSRHWLQEGWVDYFTPQLYWPVRSTGQSYPVLLEWWTRQNPHGRPIWPGLFTSKVRRSDESQGWDAREIVEQVRITQAFCSASGNVHFSMKALANNYGGVADALREGPYAEPALPPDCGELGDANAGPSMPSVQREGEQLVIDPVDGQSVWLWAVQTRTQDGWTTNIAPAAGGRRLPAPPGEAFITAVDRLGRSSQPVRVAAQ